MKTRKEKNKKGNESRSHDDVNQSMHQKNKTQHKIKYRHQNHWLEEIDDDYQLPKYEDEDE
jgi:hypothetical protein